MIDYFSTLDNPPKIIIIANMFVLFLTKREGTQNALSKKEVKAK